MLCITYDETRTPDEGQFYLELAGPVWGQDAHPHADRGLCNRLGYWCDEAHLQAWVSSWKERLESSAQAIAICKGCPVRLECLRHAMNNNERLGVWGGISQQSRRNGRRDGLSPERLIELHG